MLPSFSFDGHVVPFMPGDTYASALYRGGHKVLSRSLKYHRPRGMYCNAGNCAGCLVGVDGIPNVLACMENAREGAVLASQNRLGTAKHDLLGVVDKVFPQSFDPHNAFTKPKWVNEAFLASVRMMSGLGTAPKTASPKPPARFRRLRVDELVIGAGAAGLRRAKEASRRNRSTILVEEAPVLGGSAAWNPLEIETRLLAMEAPTWRGVEVWTETVCFGLYRDAQLRRAVEAGLRRRLPNGGEELLQVSARRISVAVGKYDAWPLFAGNDLPGVLSLRAALRLMGQGVKPGRRIVVHGRLPPLVRAQWQNAGITIVCEGQVEASHGGYEVEAATVSGERVDCDAIIVVQPRLERLELFQQAGCRFEARGGQLQTVRDRHGATTHPQVYAMHLEDEAW